jgi:alpha-1,2-mannosyltransferase
VVFVAAALVALALSFPILWHQIYADPTNRLVDLEVYREAGRSVLDSRAVYEFRTPEPQDLPFTYPPFAAVLSVPLALVHFMVAGWIWELASLVVLIGLVAFLYRPVVEWWRDWLSTRYGDRAATLTAAALAPLLLPALIWLEPVRTTFRFGQVNIFMIALVVADCCLPRTRWPRGVLVGLATAIKLTPGLFVPYLWLTGRRRAAYVATATFVAAQGLAMVVIPGDSVDYWTDAFFSSGRLGNNRGTANIAIRGALMRWWLPGVILAAVLLVIAGGVLVVGMSRAVRASQAGAEVAGVTIVGLITVAISPVSWDPPAAGRGAARRVVLHAHPVVDEQAGQAHRLAAADHLPADQPVVHLAGGRPRPHGAARGAGPPGTRRRCAVESRPPAGGSLGISA